MKFCFECGSPVEPGARFCVNCGQELVVPAAPAARSKLKLSATSAGVFALIVVAGLAVTGMLAYQQHKIQQKEASATSNGLPPGHPQIKLPKQARDFIAQVEANAESKPNDLAVWDRLGSVALRAAAFDSTYYKLATKAFGHALQLNENDPQALRGVGDIDYDLQHFDEAIAAYEHYLKLKPNDPDVQVDLGTMYLYTNNPDQALAMYHKAISIRPDFFQGYYNMGVAYAAENNSSAAQGAFEQAFKLAPDKAARSQVSQMLTKLGVKPPAQPQSPVIKTEVAPAHSFQGAIDAMLHNLPVAGKKVAGVNWPSKSKAVALMNNFPMGGMPPFIRQRFADDLTSGVKRAREAYHMTTPFELDIADAATGHVMEVIATDKSGKLVRRSPGGAGSQTAWLQGGSGNGAASAGASAQTVSDSAKSSAASTFRARIESLVRDMPVAGRKVETVKWPSKDKALVLMENFPMDQMPPFMRNKFISDLTSGVEQAKQAFHIKSPFELDIADAATGRVMETITK